MEKFILLFRSGNTHISAANSQAAMHVIQTWNDWMQGLAEKGILAGGDAFQVSGKYVKDTNKVILDGLYAVEISKGCPILNEDGSIEVRPIQKRN